MIHLYPVSDGFDDEALSDILALYSWDLSKEKSAMKYKFNTYFLLKCIVFFNMETWLMWSSPESCSLFSVVDYSSTKWDLIIDAAKAAASVTLGSKSLSAFSSHFR